MLPWWGWLTLWGVLVLGGALIVGLRVRDAWRSGTALTAEVGRVSRLVEQLDLLAEPGSGPDTPGTAVTQDPSRMWAHYRAGRSHRRTERSIRRAERMPPWARVD